MVMQIALSYQEDLIKVAVLNYAIIGEMTGSFCRVHFS